MQARCNVQNGCKAEAFTRSLLVSYLKGDMSDNTENFRKYDKTHLLKRYLAVLIAIYCLQYQFWNSIKKFANEHHRRCMSKRASGVLIRTCSLVQQCCEVKSRCHPRVFWQLYKRKRQNVSAVVFFGKRFSVFEVVLVKNVVACKLPVIPVFHQLW